jgi:hypothetical protein
MSESNYSGKSDDDFAKYTPQDWASYWTKEFNASKKWMQSYHAAGRKVEAEYLSQHMEQQDEGNNARFNVFWANVQVVLATVYAKLPAPEVDRLHLDQNDDVARVAANMLQRIFEFELDDPRESPEDIYKLAIQDRFVPGIGIVWPRYEFQSQTTVSPPIMSPDGTRELAPQVEMTVITDERAPIDYVRWDDFFYSPCRTWQEKRWLARRVYMNKRKIIERFGKVIAEQVQLKSGQSKSLAAEDPMRQSPEPLGEIIEIWCEEFGGTFWFSIGAAVILDFKANPLGLTGFYPVAKPLIASHLTNAFLPRPDFAMVQDQYGELNLLASRMKLLTEALKVVGVYNKTADGVQRLLNQAGMNQLIPVDNWAMFAEAGGIKGAIDWLPLDMVISTLVQMTERKKALLQEVYEILGLSDLMRGMSVASETATAQQLKSQYGFARISRSQDDIAKFLTTSTQIRAEIICNHWQPQTIIERSQIMQTPDAKLAQQAVMLLKSSSQIALRLKITADTTAAPDWNQEKQQRIDFLQATSQFIGMSMPLIQQHPGSGIFLIQMLQWAATGFKAGKEIEGVLDQAVDALKLSLATPPPPKPPTPKELKEHADAEKGTAEAKQTNAETMAALMRNGYSPEMLAQIPPGSKPPGPPPQGPQGQVQLPPGGGGPGRPPQTAIPNYPPPQTVQ